MSKRKKYSYDFKLKVVREYAEGRGSYKYLVRKHGISSHSVLERWVNTYREFGEEGLRRSRANNEYSLEFKLKALEMYETSEKSYIEVANELGMNNSTLIAAWKMKYRKEGIEGLSKKRGHPIVSTKEKSPSDKSPTQHLAEADKDQRIKELEYENRLLKIKNEYLELLRSLGQEETKKKQESSSNSGDNTN